MPSEEELLKTYQEVYWARFKDEQVGPARENLYMHVIEWLGDLCPRGGRLVDVGCGGGAFLVCSRTAGWRAIGFDLSMSAVAHARSLGLEAYVTTFPPCTLQDETVDAVTFINVLDHLRDPLGALQEAWRVLRPGGALYIRVPNGPFHVRLLSLLSPIGLARYAVFHLYGFSSAAFRHHLPRLGFRVVAVRTAPPSQGDPYSQTGVWKAFLRRFLKLTDQAVYRLLSGLGLDRLAWGPSIEVMARKGRDGTGGTDNVHQGDG